jgi:transcription elongation GreA/GreB family factor
MKVSAAAHRNRISWVSPLGRALMKDEVGSG